MSWKEAFEKGEEVVLVTASKNSEPNAIVIIYAIINVFRFII